MALTESEKKAEKKEKPLTKVVIRRLPPTMTKEQFLEQVSPLPDYNYLYHVKGDMSLGENAFSRAYINFMCPEDVYSFKDKFDNYVFIDARGHEYIAVVEFAPFQKIPKKRGKARVDPKCNSINLDTYYLEFVESLNKPVEQNEKPEYTLQLGEKNDNKNNVTTPLLEFLKNKRAQKQKMREMRREEREKRKKEFEGREGKFYEKKYDERSPSKAFGKKSSNPKYFKGEPSSQEKPVRQDEKDKPEVKPKEKKFEEKKERKEIKPRFPKKEYTDSKESNRVRSKPPVHSDEPKQEEPRAVTKKIKKYSERREERKLEAQKAEQKKLEQQAKVDSSKEVTEQATSQAVVKVEKESDSDLRMDDKSDNGSSRRIRNKDRPTIPLYRPGMLSKRKQSDPEEKVDEKKNENKKE